jgi:hypothetical protein
MRLPTTRRKEIERAIPSRHKAVDTDTDKDRSLHERTLPPRPGEWTDKASLARARPYYLPGYCAAALQL